jgi:hypothetical protein
MLLVAKNQVVAGDYKGYIVIETFGEASISFLIKSVPLNKSTVQAYEVVTADQRKSVASGIGRGIAGGLLTAPIAPVIGIGAGLLSAKTKGTYQVAIQFKDGKRSLIEVDDKIYRAIVRKCF